MMRRWLIRLLWTLTGVLAINGLAVAHPGHHEAPIVPPTPAADVDRPSPVTSSANDTLAPTLQAGPSCPNDGAPCGCHLDGCVGSSEPRIAAVGPCANPPYRRDDAGSHAIPLPSESPRVAFVARSTHARAPPILP